MSQPDEISIYEYELGPNRRAVELSCEHGTGFMTFNEIERTAYIDNAAVDEDFRGQGISKKLLGKVLEVATDLDADRVHASIISREAIDACVSVFGEDAVIVHELGSYTERGDAPRHDASAILWYEIPRDPGIAKT